MSGFNGRLLADSYEVIEQAGELIQAAGVYAIALPTDPDDPASDPEGDAMAHYSIPQAGDRLNAGAPDLRVIERAPRLRGVNDDNIATVEIAIRWELQKGSANYSVRGGADVEQISTNYDSWDPDAREVITVEYDSKQQGGIIQVYEPTNFFEVEVVETVADPDGEIVNKWVGHVNNQAWRGGEARQWLVWSIRYELLEILEGAVDSARYRFLWQFRRSRVGWDPDVHFENKDGTTPHDLVDGEGLKTIEYYPSKNFNVKFNNLPSA